MLLIRYLKRFQHRLVIFIAVLFLASLACARSQQSGSSFWSISEYRAPVTPDAPPQSILPTLPAGAFVPTHIPGEAPSTPTPDTPHDLPSLRTETREHVVKPGETLGVIANEYGLGLQQLVEANKLVNPDFLEVGWKLQIPAPTPSVLGSAFKIIPDSELVYGPGSAYFNVQGFIQSKGGYLANYSEEVDSQTLTGGQIIDRLAREFSVNPRLLLAVLEYQSGWVTKPNADPTTLEYPIRLKDQRRKGLYLQLSYAANNLNRGYYLWRVNSTPTWVMADGSVIPIDPTINAGTAGVQHFFATMEGLPDWQTAVSPDGLYATYNALFGFPFDYAFEPVLPEGLEQPKLQLPFEPGNEWAFTGGPHGGWGDGSAWAALDFAPPGDAVGCVPSNDWVVAAAPGMILRASNGAVVQDLDLPGFPADGLESTGWTLLYMHVETRDRVQPGTYLKVGDHIGHPSCEGGFSNGTHVHLARRYNGEWIPADQKLPFNLDGWVSSGAGNMYDGYLTRAGRQLEAYAGRNENNGIAR